MKSIFITIAISAAIVATLYAAAWHGMNKQLCSDNLPPSEYAAMELDCMAYGIDRQ